ncbi:protein FAR-RED IMPAIRED RESPONSE 1-like [Olea europaea var. sylvestris]|uniref:protein FAR-RED IMPAIRED RESPONSE 1-like n=1 Tax=Olea europaea var. sylvestris TaxID=158386 RepID=UPI000C1D451C|nr:protein FAR-RED IMPAIRED RESPONSE 1-like [Olea europaea var. sylvestris]
MKSEKIGLPISLGANFLCHPRKVHFGAQYLQYRPPHFSDDGTGGTGVIVIVPEVGMKFNDENEIFNFYKRYAYDMGFLPRRENINNTSVSVKSQATMQSGCKAKLIACSNICGVWRINTVYLDYNHKTSPSKSRLFRCNRQLSAQAKFRLEVNDIAGIPLHKSFNSAVVEAAGYENMTCIEKDSRNYVEQVRQLRLGEGDTAAIQSYFSTMKARCSGFYFSIDSDEESRLKKYILGR